MILKIIKVDTFVLLKTNCYIIADEVEKKAMIVDPGGSAEEILKMIEILDVKVEYIFLTHCHSDHIGAVSEVKEKTGAKILISREDSTGLFDPNINMSYLIKLGTISLEADSRVDDNDIIHVGKIEFKVLLTPGHTKGSTCLYCSEYNMLLTGDTIFRGTWGRTDLPTSNFEEIINSITNKIMCLPDETIIYPGHGKSSLLKDEKMIYLELKKY